MAKRSYDPRKSRSGNVVKVVPKAPEVVRLVLQKDLKLNVTGAVTGKVYSFNGAGSKQDVDKKDAEELLKRRRNTNCCPGSGVRVSSPYFEIAR